jgi:hypothetical protein
MGCLITSFHYKIFKETFTGLNALELILLYEEKKRS